jgi:hypothetical protein
LSCFGPQKYSMIKEWWYMFMFCFSYHDLLTNQHYLHFIFSKHEWMICIWSKHRRWTHNSTHMTTTNHVGEFILVIAISKKIVIVCEDDQLTITLWLDKSVKYFVYEVRFLKIISPLHLLGYLFLDIHNHLLSELNSNILFYVGQ